MLIEVFRWGQENIIARIAGQTYSGRKLFFTGTPSDTSIPELYAELQLQTRLLATYPNWPVTHWQIIIKAPERGISRRQLT